MSHPRSPPTRRPSPRHAHPPLLPLHHRDFRPPQNENSFTIKMHLLHPHGEAVPGDLFVKVVGAPDETATRVVIRFTSVAQDIRTFLDAVGLRSADRVINRIAVRVGGSYGGRTLLAAATAPGGPVPGAVKGDDAPTSHARGASRPGGVLTGVFSSAARDSRARKLPYHGGHGTLCHRSADVEWALCRRCIRPPGRLTGED
jgi:hypothetical protein